MAYDFKTLPGQLQVGLIAGVGFSLLGAIPGSALVQVMALFVVLLTAMTSAFPPSEKQQKDGEPPSSAQPATGRLLYSSIRFIAGTLVILSLVSAWGGGRSMYSVRDSPQGVPAITLVVPDWLGHRDRYAPANLDSPEVAAAKLQQYLGDRFGITVEATEMRGLVGEAREEVPAQWSTWLLPPSAYPGSIRRVQEEFGARIFLAALMRNLVVGLLAFALVLADYTLCLRGRVSRLLRLVPSALLLAFMPLQWSSFSDEWEGVNAAAASASSDFELLGLAFWVTSALSVAVTTLAWRAFNRERARFEDGPPTEQAMAVAPH